MGARNRVVLGGRGDLIQKANARLTISVGSRRLLGAIFLLLLAAVGLNSLSPTVRLVGTALLASPLAVWWAWNGLWRGRLRLAPDPLLWLLAAGLILQATSLLWTPFPRPAEETFLQNVLLFTLFLTAYTSLRSGWSPETWETSLILLGGAFALVELLLFGGWLASWWAIDGVESFLPPIGYRSSGLLFGHANVLAGFLTMLLPLLLARAVQSPRRAERAGWGATFIALAAIQFLTSSRGGWLASAAGIGATVVLLLLPRIRGGRAADGWRRLRGLIRRRIGLVVPAALVALLATLAGAWQLTGTGHAPLGGSRLPVWRGALALIARAPLRGSGLRSFPPLFSQLPLSFHIEDIPHAHNLLLELWAEGGLISVGLVGLGVALVLRRLVRRQRSAGPAPTPVHPGLLGAAAGAAVHNTVDYLFGVPLYTASFLVLLAVLLAATHRPRRPARPVDREGAAAVIALALASTLALPLLLRGDWTYWRGIQAAVAGDWARAAEDVCRSHRLDPSSAIYASACPLVQQFAPGDGLAELAARAEIQDPIEIAVERDPFWYRHWLNAAILSGQQGDWPTAVSLAEEAAQRVPGSATVQLNLGYALESAGDLPAARRRYQQALALDPGVANAAFFDATDLRSEVRENAGGQPPANPTTRLLVAAERALQRGDLDEAGAQLERAAELSPGSARLHTLRARWYLQRSRPADARRELQIARFIAGDTPDALTVMAQWALGQGQLTTAQEAARRALETIVFRSDSQRYYFAAHGRPSPPSDALLGTVNPAFTTELDQLVGEIVELSGVAERLELSALRQLARRSAGPVRAEQGPP